MSLRSYLNAPEAVRDAFDRKVKRAIDADLAAERWVEQELADDPVAQAVARRRRNDALIADALGLGADASSVDVRWDESWQRRAKAPQRVDGMVYNRDTDPLFTINLREAWETLTGEEVPGWGRVHCPNPDHDDRFPDCDVTTEVFNCLACEAGGSIIDLGAFLYGLTPRGGDFFRIRQRLLADLGMAEAA